jgi:hypothetical protein
MQQILPEATLQQLKALTYQSQDTDILNWCDKRAPDSGCQVKCVSSKEGIYPCVSREKKRNTEQEMKQKLENTGCIYS